jgi:hypothetical protein
MTYIEASDRYLQIVEWARKRYTKKGWLLISTGRKLSTYSLIEKAAFARYSKFF